MGILTLPTLEPVQVQALSETLAVAFFKDTDLLALHAIETGIKAKKQIVIMNRHTGLAGYKKPASCDRTANDTFAIDHEEKLWDPEFIGDLFEECYDDYMATFVAWQLKNGLEKMDMTDNVMKYLAEHLLMLMKEVIFRIAYFGDEGIAAGVNNNLGAGDLKYFNPIDGLFAQLADIVTADATRLSTTDLTTKNGQATFALQKFDSTDTTSQVATTALDTLYYDGSQSLRDSDKSDLKYYVTRSVYDQLERERKSLGAGSIVEVYKLQESGVPKLYINGIEVVEMPFWDRMINAYFQDGTAWVNPHRVVLMPKDNFVIGTEDQESLSRLKIWFSDDDAMNRAEFGFMLDVKVLIDEMVQVAY